MKVPTAAITAGATSITLDSVAGLPAIGSATIGGDTLTWTNIVAATKTLTGIPATGTNALRAHPINSYLKYSASYAARMAEATKLVKRYQGANYLKNPIKVHLLFRNNARRTAQYDLFAASWAKVGFQVVGPGIPNWSSNTKNLDYDAAIFAWGANLPVQVGDCPQEESASSNATWGWKNKTIDAACKSLEAGALSNSNRDKYWLLMEKALASEAYTLPLFQWPGVTAINSALNGVKPSPITPNLVWNYWEWNY